MGQLDQIKLFLQGAGIKETSELIDTIQSFFQQAIEGQHLIFKRSILYFYQKENVVNSIPCSSTDDNVYTFDGTKVSRIKPEYYLGSAASLVAGAAVLNTIETEFGGGGYSNNNNNNNNNNNGNNNG